MRALLIGGSGQIRSALGRNLTAHGVDVLDCDGDAGSTQTALAALDSSDAVVRLGEATSTAAAPEPTQAPRRIFVSTSEVARLPAPQAGPPTLTVRTAAIIGRGVRSRATDQFAGPAVVRALGTPPRRQFVHSDDVIRFLSLAVRESRTGSVALAADGSLSLDEVAALLHKRVVQVPGKIAAAIAPAAVRAWPVVDTVPLHDDFDFFCAWSNTEAVIDTRRSLITYLDIGPVRLKRRSYVPFTQPGWRPDMSPAGGRALRPIGPDELRGEFDDDVDPAMSTFTATNVGEAFPGPMTPLSLQLGLLSLRAGSDAAGRLVGLDGELAHETQARSMCSFGHRVYLNVSVIRGVFDLMPGSTPEQADAQYLGVPLPPDYRQPKPRWSDIKAVGTVLRDGGLAMARIGVSERWLVDEANRLELAPDALCTMTDAELDARIALLIDTFVDSQVVNGCVQAVGAAALSAAERRTSGEVAAGGLASSRALEGVHRVADLVRSDDAARTALDKYRHQPDAMQRLADVSPALYEALQRLLAEVGHRGPGEFELANATFADRPALLLDAIHQSSRVARPAATAQPSGRRVSAVERYAGAALQRRERVRDASIRIFHQLRNTLRQKGERLSAAHLLQDSESVFYLTIDEVFHPPADAAEVVIRRRAERERLKTIEPPPHIDGDWQPVGGIGDDSPSPPTLAGAGVSRGTARGTVRILADPDDGLEPGEVLVCRVTDIGWTPLFASAAAVVSEIGGAMSHTAVVAREFAIPAVVGVASVTRHLRDGQLVEVDGGTGRITVLADNDCDQTPTQTESDVDRR